MAQITFTDAQGMTNQGNAWMKGVSDFIIDPVKNPKPTNIYGTQKLAFEIDKTDLAELLASGASKIIGVLGYETASNSLTVILVGTDASFKPSAANPPRQTWPMLKRYSNLSDVVNIYLKP